MVAGEVREGTSYLGEEDSRLQMEETTSASPICGAARSQCGQSRDEGGPSQRHKRADRPLEEQAQTWSLMGVGWEAQAWRALSDSSDGIARCFYEVTVLAVWTVPCGQCRPGLRQGCRTAWGGGVLRRCDYGLEWGGCPGGGGVAGYPLFWMGLHRRQERGEDEDDAGALGVSLWRGFDTRVAPSLILGGLGKRTCFSLGQFGAVSGGTVTRTLFPLNDLTRELPPSLP